MEKERVDFHCLPILLCLKYSTQSIPLVVDVPLVLILEIPPFH